MKYKSFLVLFIVSILAIFLLEDGMMRNFSILRFAPPFIFVSLPFILAYLFGWKKGFGVSVITSIITFIYIYQLIAGKGDGWGVIYAAFFASFSVVYWILSAAVVFIAKRTEK